MPWKPAEVVLRRGGTTGALRPWGHIGSRRKWSKNIPDEGNYKGKGPEQGKERVKVTLRDREEADGKPGQSVKALGFSGTPETEERRHQGLPTHSLTACFSQQPLHFSGGPSPPTRAGQINPAWSLGHGPQAWPIHTPHLPGQRWFR